MPPQTIKLVIASAITCLLAGAAQAQVYIVHTNVVDVESQSIRPDYTVVIKGDTIVDLGPSSKIRPKPGAQLIDGAGKWLMPGLVDAHVHFFQTGGLYTRPDGLD